jgi:hypothetical protein
VTRRAHWRPRSLRLCRSQRPNCSQERDQAWSETPVTTDALPAYGIGASRNRRCSSRKRAPIVCPARSRFVSCRASSRASKAALMAASVGPVGIGTRACCRSALPRASTPPFVVALTRPTEARLEEVVGRQRRKARRQRPLAAHQNAHDGRLEIVVLLCPRSICAGAGTRPLKPATVSLPPPHNDRSLLTGMITRRRWRKEVVHVGALFRTPSDR